MNAQDNAPSQRAFIHAFGKIGLLSFGGPAAQIAVMHRVLVEEKGWLSEQQFLHALNFCMLLPGPEAMQLTTYAGWLMKGVRGGVIAGMLFVMPGLVMMLALSSIYVAYGDVPLLAGVFYGLKAAVIAVVLQALVKLTGKTLKAPMLYAIAMAAFVGIFFLRVPFPLIILAAALSGALLRLRLPQTPPVGEQIVESAVPQNLSATGQSVRAILIWGGLWLVPLGLLTVLYPGGFAQQAALFFSQLAVVTFGGAYAVLAYVSQQAIEVYGWLSAADMLKGLGLAETTLGPLVLVLVFVGFVGGANAGEGVSHLAGLWGGLLAAFFTFVPCFVWVFVGAPHVERLRQVQWLNSALTAVTAAVVGVIANLAVWFALAVLFGAPKYRQRGPIWLPDADFSKLDLWAGLLAVIAIIALLRFNVNLMAVLAAAAFAGMALVTAGIVAA
ncbi:MAG: chromate efflux transporter [Ahrensia sp.]